MNNIWHNNEERPKNGYYIAGLTCSKYSDNTERWGFIIGDYAINSRDGIERVYEEENCIRYSEIIKWAYYEDFVNYIKSEIL